MTELTVGHHVGVSCSLEKGLWVLKASSPPPLQTEVLSPLGSSQWQYIIYILKERVERRRGNFHLKDTVFYLLTQIPLIATTREQRRNVTLRVERNQHCQDTNHLKTDTVVFMVASFTGFTFLRFKQMCKKSIPIITKTSLNVKHIITEHCINMSYCIVLLLGFAKYAMTLNNGLDIVSWNFGSTI